MDVFREEMTALLPDLRRFAHGLAGDRHLADDIVHDTVADALRAQHQFTPGTDLRAWLFTILRNRFRSLIARKHVTAEVADVDLERHWWMAWAQDSWIGVEAFRRAFRSLGRPHREALVLAVVHGLPYESIAEICGCRTGTVKSRVNRARTLLKRLLLGDDGPGASAPMPSKGPQGKHSCRVAADARVGRAAATASSGLAAPG
jgi:RNA polymerase sigma-70 factor, ECF subfamily